MFCFALERKIRTIFLAFFKNKKKFLKQFFLSQRNFLVQIFSLSRKRVILNAKNPLYILFYFPIYPKEKKEPESKKNRFFN